MRLCKFSCIQSKWEAFYFFATCNKASTWRLFFTWFYKVFTKFWLNYFLFSWPKCRVRWSIHHWLLHIWFGLLTRLYPQNIKYLYIILEQMFITLLEMWSIVGMFLPATGVLPLFRLMGRVEEHVDLSFWLRKFVVGRSAEVAIAVFTGWDSYRVTYPCSVWKCFP